MKHDGSAETRTRILAAALEHFGRYGFAGASVRAICESAGANGAAINYHFRSKEQLYLAVFRRLFEDFGLPLTRLPDGVHDAASWSAAVEEWVVTVLGWMVSDDPPHCWSTRLFTHERHTPSSALPFLIEHCFRPVRDSLDRLVRMGLPADADEATVTIWSTSILGQVTIFADRQPPWDRQIIPTGIGRSEWQAAMACHIVEGILSRLRYRGGTGHAAVRAGSRGAR